MTNEEFQKELDEKSKKLSDVPRLIDEAILTIKAIQESNIVYTSSPIWRQDVVTRDVDDALRSLMHAKFTIDAAFKAFKSLRNK